MKKLYLDRTEIPSNMAIIVGDADVIAAGATVYSMPISEREHHEEYRCLADNYDIHFVFDDVLPELNFYAVPQFDVFAYDSCGGLFGSVGEPFDMELPVYYIDRERNCFHVADSGKEFLEHARNWKNMLKPYEEIEFFVNKESAALKYVLFGRTDLEKHRLAALRNLQNK